MTILLVIGAGVAALVYNLVTPASLSIANDKKTAAALARAKEALIGYAASYPDQPGVLPCPDSDNDGTADSPCGPANATAIGRLPWKTLGLPNIRDGSGECLWYAVSANFKKSSTGPASVNSDTPGTLTVTDGTGSPLPTPPNPVLAIVFAPGPSLSGQSRVPSSSITCGGRTGSGAAAADASAYLDTTAGINNATGNGAANNFITAAQSNTFNDQLLAITSDALFAVVAMRVAREVRTFLTIYFNTNGYYPFASNYGNTTFSCVPGLTRGRLPKPGGIPGYDISTGCGGLADWTGLGQPASWFTTNNWHLLTYYTVAPACINTTPNCAGIGYITVNNTQAPNDNKRALVIVTGRALSGQLRPCAGVADCLEDPENTNLDDVYVKNPISSTFNDKFVIVAP